VGLIYRWLAWFVLPAAICAQPVPPSAAERDRVLNRVGEFAREYIEHLPNFICLRETIHYTRTAEADAWKPQAKVGEELSFYAREEHSRVVAVDDKPAKSLPRRWESRFVYSSGNFGYFLQAIFQGQLHATIQWKGWDTVRGRRAWAFSYRMPAGYGAESCRGITVYRGVCENSNFPYHGLIEVAEDGSAVLRLTVEPEKPESNAWESRTIDYDRVAIAGVQYLLPVADTLFMEIGNTDFRNQSVYRDYRKFTAESVIKPAPGKER